MKHLTDLETEQANGRNPNSLMEQKNNVKHDLTKHSTTNPLNNWHRRLHSQQANNLTSKLAKTTYLCVYFIQSCRLHT